MFVCNFLGQKAFELAPSLLSEHLGDYWFVWTRKGKVVSSARFPQIRKYNWIWLFFCNPCITLGLSLEQNYLSTLRWYIFNICFLHGTSTVVGVTPLPSSQNICSHKQETNNYKQHAQLKLAGLSLPRVIYPRHEIRKGNKR